jgi:hypothetical protein
VGFELVDLRDYPLPFFDEPKSLGWARTKQTGYSDDTSRRVLPLRPG